MKPPGSVAIIIVSKGRPAVLAETLEGIPRQTLKASQVIIVVTCDDDFPVADRPSFAEVHLSKPGLCTQRNAGLAQVTPDTDYVAFFDDDMELRADYLEKAIHFLDDLPGVAAITGQILKDGGIDREEARSLIAGYQPVEKYSGLFIRDVKHAILYGCCMTIRRSLLDYEKFDENLPLYSFGEDYDISMRLRRYGLIGKYQKCIAVHLKTQGGRVNEVQRGYSIVANNWYFLKKGVVHLPPVLALARFWLIVVAKLLIEALWKSMRRKQDTDWLRRAEGFVLAVVDIVRGRSAPQRIVDFSKRP